MLGSFLFSGDDVEKKVAVLSGGERSRLALCKMLLQSSNFLILDEPTNHLDMVSKEVLKNALKLYKGTVIIVSHDRDFLIGLTNKVVEFRDGQIKTHLGDINDYLRFRKTESMRDVEIRSRSHEKELKTPMDRSDKKRLEKEIKKMSNQISKIERRIEELEGFIEQYDQDLQNPIKADTFMSDSDFFAKYEKIKGELDEQMYEWESLQSKMEVLLKQR
ncbi:MAG: hypothetical protein CM15mP23_01290 [Cryomorphaceae bacterium]|nr:MAG: hypothetical protein CM15mP23_01290 [Cryomorphaceae bacterium]